MITLYTFGRMFGLPDPSPFVTKAEVLLKMSGLPYRCDTGGFGKAPKGKLPYIDDDGTVVADSTFIRWHLEDKHGIDFDKGLGAVEKSTAWAVEKMCENELYWAVVYDRWLDDARFDRGPRKFFDRAPALVRPAVIAMVRRKVRRELHGQGLGRHTQAERERIARRDLVTIADILGDKPWLMGQQPCGADATTFPFVLGVLCPHFQSPLRTAAEGMKTLVAYRDRGLATWFPDLGRG